ncbi:MAG: universal stress protein [Pseudomonadota bacterium]
MYNRIMVPVDLGHTPGLEKALATAANLAKTFNCPVCYVGVTTETPSSEAHNPAEFASKLDSFAKDQAAKYGHEAMAKSYVGHDVSIELNQLILKAAVELGADLIIMASHVPTFLEHIWPASHGGNIASHASASVFVVR